MECGITVMFVLRPVVAVALVISLIILGWVGAWKLVLVHVPLVQELTKTKGKSTKKAPQPQPLPLPRLSRFLLRSHTRGPVHFPREAEG
ncbi:hypothetical protein SUGI_0926510 [Cryptomeria japonica]|uniref:uncharacterized protein LOC131029719 isoform X2 n=1 Tax=Cryptomeria japonica TaxID=3369 RepID=UPI00241489F4|nr:uncharacterized protein LOC131029719 isoform X2 [Cryptomeria japonica]GLJ44277.1 hypothetical protein SUGI_0926510 [Cryptomeria japonica]